MKLIFIGPEWSRRHKMQVTVCSVLWPANQGSGFHAAQCTGSLHTTFDSSCCALTTEEPFVSCCAQWKGARILYLKLAQDPKSIADFAKQLECESCISRIINMLQHPSKDPISVFALDVSSSKSSTQFGRLIALATLVMQAQMTGVLLSIILQLALADSNSLMQHMYEAGGLAPLHLLAMDCTKHTHPDIDTVRSIKLARHDVHAKLAQLYR